MKIIVKGDKAPNTVFRFPTGLVLNRFSVIFIYRYIKKKGSKLTMAQTAAFVKALNKYRRNHKEWKLIEAYSSDGEKVEIVV